MKSTITRKELSSILMVSEDTLIRREREWGLVRLKKFQRPIQYDWEKTILTLRGNGVITSSVR